MGDTTLTKSQRDQTLKIMTQQFNSYTYLQVRKSDRMLYHGSHKIATKRTPEEDFMKFYFGSGVMGRDAKKNPEDYEGYILTQHTDYWGDNGALEEEIRFHREFEVGLSPDFANGSPAGNKDLKRMSPEFKAAQSARAKAMNADPEFKAALSARSKAMNADPEVKAAQSARMKARHTDPEFKEAQSARAKAMNADPEFKASLSARSKSMQADPEFKAAQSARMKARHTDPEFKEAQSARSKAMHADPEFKAAQIARLKAMNADPNGYTNSIKRWCAEGLSRKQANTRWREEKTKKVKVVA